MSQAELLQSRGIADIGAVKIRSYRSAKYFSQYIPKNLAPTRIADGDPLEQIYFNGWNNVTVRDHSLLRKWFQVTVDGIPTIQNSFPNDPEKRLPLLQELSKTARRMKKTQVKPAGSHDPALLAVLSEEKDRLKRLLECKGSQEAYRKLSHPLKRKLYDYQSEGVERFLKEGRLLLADDMGLGKTAQAIASCHILWHTKKVKRGLIIVPASLKSQWLREWQLFSDTPVELVEGNPEDRKAFYRRNKNGFLIVNYEQVLRDVELMAAWKANIIVLDEAQRIKNWATKTATFVKCLQPQYRLVLTGTPLENRLEELSSILDWIAPGALGPAWRLVPWHNIYVDGSNEVLGARNLSTIRERLAPFKLRRLRTEVLKQLPERTDTRVPVAVTSEQITAHDDYAPLIARLLLIAKKRPLAQREFLQLMEHLTSQRIICNGIEQFEFENIWPELSQVRNPSETFLKGLQMPKLIELREIVSRIVLDQGRKVVIFSQWRRMLQLCAWALEGMLETKNIRAAFFTGKENQKRRTQNIVEFHDNPNLKVLFATDAGGVGLNLQHAASCCINLELPWNPAVLEQRIGRIYRLGQQNPIDVYNLVSEYGIESRIAGSVKNKKALFDNLFDGTTDEVKFETSSGFLNQIEKIVTPVETPELKSTKPSANDISIEEVEADREDAVQDFRKLDPKVESLEVNNKEQEGRDRSDMAEKQNGSLPAVTELISQVQIKRDSTGHLQLDAPPQAAEALAAMFEGMATLLRTASRE